MLKRMATLSLITCLALPGIAEASLIGAGNNDTADGSFQITSTSFPMLVSNDGSIENRAAVEFDLTGLAAGDTITDAQFTVSGIVQTHKDLSIYVYGDPFGAVTGALLDVGTPFGTVSLDPGANVQSFTFDITDFFTELGPNSYPPFVGINLRESVSNGGIVAVEYLVLVTIMFPDGSTGQITQVQGIPEPATLALVALAALAVAGARRRRR